MTKRQIEDWLEDRRLGLSPHGLGYLPLDLSSPKKYEEETDRESSYTESWDSNSCIPDLFPLAVNCTTAKPSTPPGNEERLIERQNQTLVGELQERWPIDEPQPLTESRSQLKWPCRSAQRIIVDTIARTVEEDGQEIMTWEDDPSEEPRENLKPVPPTDDEVRQVDLGTEGDPRPIFLSASLSSEEAEQYVQLLKEYLDIFAWSYAEMPGLDPEIAVHRQHIKPDAKPFKQAQRRFHPLLMEKIDKKLLLAAEHLYPSSSFLGYPAYAIRKPVPGRKPSLSPVTEAFSFSARLEPSIAQSKGTWSNHEGSILSWCRVPSFYGFLLRYRGRPQSHNVSKRGGHRETLFCSFVSNFVKNSLSLPRYEQKSGAAPQLYTPFVLRTLVDSELRSRRNQTFDGPALFFVPLYPGRKMQSNCPLGARRSRGSREGKRTHLLLHLARDEKERASSIDEQRIDGALGIALFFSPFLSASSDPFVRNFFVRTKPFAESNPVPQDPISAIHPPHIYAGDVASAMGFGLCR
ncbi:hypothetical protein NE237_002667 [Protea cynaroides]|uniref:Uncharacterized protein n=1 Tax=Protea cynaroides TaxID=273540 RepID=A0A9Q0GQ90_9MAGN|nr:hypothetical protein NE237_002667 [Protea cynaroides]